MRYIIFCLESRRSARSAPRLGTVKLLNLIEAVRLEFVALPIGHSRTLAGMQLFSERRLGGESASVF